VLDTCSNNPELINLLKTGESFPDINMGRFIGSDGQQTISNRLMVDKASETPTHFITKNLDPDYYWNEWELRKKAIQMANIRKRQTKCCQTFLSNFKIDNEAQTYLGKEASTNTVANKGTNPLRPRNYIVGLRDLTLK